MFLFLSKLLPIFVYPLGFSCLLLMATFILVWRHPRWAALSSGLGVVLLMTMSSGIVADRLLRSLEWQNIPDQPLPTADAIVVLGGAVRSAESPRPWVEVAEAGDRPLYGARLYLEQKAPHLIFSGGRIPWYGGYGATPESTDMAAIAIAMGVPATAIVEEPDSLNTRENAVNVKQILETQGWEKILLVTSAVHMPRSLRIFKKLGINAIAAPTDFLTTQAKPNQGTGVRRLLETLPDAEHLAESTRVIKEYIGTFIYWLRGWA
ncbi:MAG: YdcF family protein [Cyanothece sp. SIO2G6]|nr:YdcF family protein [Cyanothece sp. SIO2G6]